MREITGKIRADESPIENFVGIFVLIRKNHIKITEPFEKNHKTSLFFKMTLTIKFWFYQKIWENITKIIII